MTWSCTYVFSEGYSAVTLLDKDSARYKKERRPRTPDRKYKFRDCEKENIFEI